MQGRPLESLPPLLRLPPLHREHLRTASHNVQYIIHSGLPASKGGSREGEALSRHIRDKRSKATCELRAHLIPNLFSQTEKKNPILLQQRSAFLPPCCTPWEYDEWLLFCRKQQKGAGKGVVVGTQENTK